MAAPVSLSDPALHDTSDSVLSTVQSCAHCGFPVKASRLKKASHDLPFCCYGCAFAFELIKGGTEGRPVSWITVKLGISIFLAMNVMGFALALHSSSVYPDFYENLSRGGKVYDELLRYFLLFMSAPVFFLIGAPLYARMVQDVRAGRWGVDGFIALSVLAAFVYSLVNTFRGEGAVYFDIAVMVLVFLTLGRYLEAKIRFKASKSLETLLTEETQPTCKLTAEGELQVDALTLQPGDRIVLRAGSRVPVDGIIEEGAGVLDLAAMTGECMPVSKNPQDHVWSGAVLSEGFLKIRVTHKAGESWMARLRRTLAEARATKAPVEYAADRAVYWMTWFTAAFAAVGFWNGYQAHGAMAGVLRALAVLVIVCPCALGAAIPLALWKSFESITLHGILFKNLSRIETLSKIRGVFFDKTGTLTESCPFFSTVEIFGGASQEVILKAAGALARASEHPFSRAIVQELSRRGIQPFDAEDYKTAAGQGLSAQVSGRGRVFLGNLKFLKSNGIAAGEWDSSTSVDASVWTAWEGKIQARIAFEERLRPEAASVIQQLIASGLECGILTGDSSPAAARLGSLLKIPVHAGLSPEDKINWVKDWEKKHGPALVAGEGLNDGPMIAGSSVSLALRGALETARQAADFVLPDDDLSRIPWLIETARLTMEKIKSNLFWAFFYNLAAVPLAVWGNVNPVLAALIMIFSSVFIIVRSLR